jgi:hypothetical protein
MSASRDSLVSGCSSCADLRLAARRGVPAASGPTDAGRTLKRCAWACDRTLCRRNRRGRRRTTRVGTRLGRQNEDSSAGDHRCADEADHVGRNDPTGVGKRVNEGGSPTPDRGDVTDFRPAGTSNGSVSTALRCKTSAHARNPARLPRRRRLRRRRVHLWRCATQPRPRTGRRGIRRLRCLRPRSGSRCCRGDWHPAHARLIRNSPSDPTRCLPLLRRSVNQRRRSPLT